ncbi:hypothetical protein MSG28_008269 [Choristoneura fumiferana]|uniref:Uncharacterized protein n=1 Tax=Choristoneura fumiferana TaxID=7141 RepID=A0ACC0JAP3_CHOFU|nr:hypothetical protein MSG28_008269 [Choristoneura fumiferana]
MPDSTMGMAATRDTTSRPIYVPLLGTGLLSEQEGLGDSSHAGPVRIGNFTRTIELLRRLKKCRAGAALRSVVYCIVDLRFPFPSPKSVAPSPTLFFSEKTRT